MSGNKTLQEQLEAAKEKVASREFEVTITEILQTTVTVKAKSRDEAEQIVSDNWKNSEYILDADDFQGVEFKAASVKPERSRSGEER
jgi:hypothetical protein